MTTISQKPYLSVGSVLSASDPFCLEFELLATPNNSFVVSVFFITHNARVASQELRS